MDNLICFRHPDYDGKTSPVLSCKTCSGKFLAELHRLDGVSDSAAWLAKKTKEAEEIVRRQPSVMRKLTREPKWKQDVKRRLGLID